VSRPFASVLAALASLLLAHGALAQPFPNKPIRLICPFPPAGAVDIASRSTAAELSKLLAQPVTVDNKPGAGGNLGGAEAARSPADGYTLFMTTSGIQAINPALYAKMPFDPNRDLAAVSALVSLNNVLVLNPSVKANTVAELIALAKAQPGVLTYASSGSGTSIHMSAEMFKYLTHVDILHIPYKGSAPALTDLLGGQVNMMFDNIPSSLAHIKAGKLHAIATTGAKRDPALPDLPTIAEAGVAGYESGVWFGLMVPAATPKDIVAKLNDAILKVMADKDVQEKFIAQGAEPTPRGTDEFTKYVGSEIEKWTKIAKAANVKVDY